MLITSAQNPRIKSVLALSKARERSSRGLFALEGAREIRRALDSDYEAAEVYWCEDTLSAAARGILAALPPQVMRIQVTSVIFAKLAVREGTDGLIAVMRQKNHDLSTLNDGYATLLLAVQGLEKPGNLGALLRSADGAGADALLLIDQTLDLYNPLVLRSSLGTAFSVPVVTATSSELKQLAISRGWQIVAAALHDQAKAYTAIDFTVPTVILLGTEADGLTPDWLADVETLATIPMHGIADSLNVSVAGAVLLYEARRQMDLARNG